MRWDNHLKVLTFRNCEFLCCHLDGYKEQRESFIAALEKAESFIAGKPQSSKFRIWCNADDTVLDNDLIDKIAASVINFKDHIVKIAFIGIERKQQRRLTKELKANTGEIFFPHAYFSDAEKAKEWLV